MRELKLTNTVLVALVDDEEYTIVRKFKWYLHTSGAVRSTEKLNINDSISLANFILNTNQKIDHKDINPLNNQKSNLRVCNQSQNQANRIKLESDKINYSSSYKGVSLDSRTNRYQARITFQGKTKNLGTYGTEVRAALAYDKAALRFFGEFANINFKPETEKIQ